MVRGVKTPNIDNAIQEIIDEIYADSALARDPALRTLDHIQIELIVNMTIEKLRKKRILSR